MQHKKEKQQGADKYYEDFFFNIQCDGIVQWCWSKRFKEWALRLLYYKVKFLQQIQEQIKQLEILDYYAGFVSFSRGLHFRFCKRWKNYETI